MPTTYRRLPLGALLPAGIGLSVLLAGGWTLQAAARQTAPPAKSAVKPKAKSAAASPPPAAESDKKPYNFTAADMTRDEQTETGTAHNFTYVDADTSISGESLRYDNKKKLMFVKGQLVLDDGKHHVTGEKADVDYGKTKKLAIITGHVVIVIKPTKPAGSETINTVVPAGSADKGSVDVAPVTPPADVASSSDKEDSVQQERGHSITITCDRVDDYYGKKFVIMHGSLTFKQQITKNGHPVERTMTAEHAEYDGKAETMHLFAPVKEHDSDGQEFEGEKDVILGTKEGAETFETHGPVKLKGFLDNDDTGDTGDNAPADTVKNPPSKPQPAKPTPAPPSPGTPSKQ